LLTLLFCLFVSGYYNFWHLSRRLTSIAQPLLRIWRSFSTCLVCITEACSLFFPAIFFLFHETHSEIIRLWRNSLAWLFLWYTHRARCTFLTQMARWRAYSFPPSISTRDPLSMPWCGCTFFFFFFFFFLLCWVYFFCFF
jgi:hypothetical protein